MGLCCLLCIRRYRFPADYELAELYSLAEIHQNDRVRFPVANFHANRPIVMA